VTYLDLFSGIGGFALAAEWVWGSDLEILYFVEIDPFCQRVLKKHWPEVPIHDDIKTFKATQYLGRVALLTGGFPCQPVSHAGKQKGKEDDRWLWPEMARIIEECRPRWVVCENVAGLIHLGLDDVLFDLEDLGYEAWPTVIPACAVNAPHRRDRVWIIAYNVADSYFPRSYWKEISKITRKKSTDLERKGCFLVADAHGKRLGKWFKYDSPDKFPSWAGGSLPMPWPITEWTKDGEVERIFCGVADGISAGLDGCEVKIPSRN